MAYQENYHLLHCVVFDPFGHKTCILINEKNQCLNIVFHNIKAFF